MLLVSEIVEMLGKSLAWLRGFASKPKQNKATAERQQRLNPFKDDNNVEAGSANAEDGAEMIAWISNFLRSIGSGIRNKDQADNHQCKK